MYYTYVLEVSDESAKTKKLYVGFTKNLIQRIEDHKTNSTKTTKNKMVKLIYYEACLNEHDARLREKALKTGFGRGYLKRRLVNDTLMRD
jgi:putative endonuclease